MTMKRLVIACLTVVVGMSLGASITPSAAFSQTWSKTEPPGGTRIPAPAPARVPDTTRLSEGERARVVLNAYAQCLVARNRRGVDAILAEKPIPRRSSPAFQRLAVSECLDAASMRFSPELFAGALYLAVLRADFERAERIPALQSVDYAKDQNLNDPVVQQYVASRHFSNCVVMAAPKETANLLFSREGTAQETAAISQLMPFLNSCLSQGQTIRFSRPVLLGWLAESMYRSATSAPLPSPQ